MRTSQPGDLCNSRGRLVYPLADDAAAHDTAGIVALRINHTLRLRYWPSIRNQKGVIQAGATKYGLLSSMSPYLTEAELFVWNGLRKLPKGGFSVLRAISRGAFDRVFVLAPSVLATLFGSAGKNRKPPSITRFYATKPQVTEA